MSLLETALTHSRSKSPKRSLPLDRENFELALALLEGRVSIRQATAALFPGTKNTYSEYACWSLLKRAVREGKIKISIVDPSLL
jgi:hypothetical protein